MDAEDAGDSLAISGERDRPAQPLVSVIVPHYHDLGSLDRCLAALVRQNYPREAFELIVADNQSPEGEAAVREAVAGRARLVIVPEQGAGPARNGGAAAARGRILAFTDCDCLPQPGWLAAGLKALESCDFVGGRMTVLVEDRSRMTPSEAFETVFAFDNRTYVQRMGFSVTANLFCRREVFDRVGGFRVRVSEDKEWCWRARAAGYRIGYAEEAVVGHPARRNWPELVRKWRRVVSESYELMNGSLGGRAKWAARALSLPLSAVLHTPRIWLARQLPGVRERLQATAVLYRLRLWRTGVALALLVGKPSR